MLESVVRVVVSLAVVLGLFWVVARTGSRKLGGRDRGLMRVRSRQSLSRGSSLAVVEVGTRVLVVGVSDSGVRLLTEMEPAELTAPADLPATLPEGADESFEAVYEAAYDQTLAAYQAAPTAPMDESGPTPMPTSLQPTSADGPLAGSLLAPSTWRHAWSTATARTARPEHGDAA